MVTRPVPRLGAHLHLRPSVGLCVLSALRLPPVPPPDRGRRRPAARWHAAPDGGEACADHRIVRSCLPTVIARSPCDEAIQTVSVERYWIASLRSQRRSAGAAKLASC